MTTNKKIEAGSEIDVKARSLMGKAKSTPQKS